MKFVAFIGLMILLGLSGCASTGVITPSNPDGVDTLAGSALSRSNPLASNAASSFIPSGALQPITAAQASSRAVTQLAPPANLWARIQRGFAMPNLESDLVTDREQWYNTRHGAMRI